MHGATIKIFPYFNTEEISFVASNRMNCVFSFQKRFNCADQGSCLPCTFLLYNLHLRVLPTRRWTLPVIKPLFNTVTLLYLALHLGDTYLNWKGNCYVLSNHFNVQHVVRILKYRIISLLCLARFWFIFSKTWSDSGVLHLTVVHVVSENFSLYQLY